MNDLGKFGKALFFPFLAAVMMVSLFSCDNQPDKGTESGQTLYEKNCVICHGKDGKLMAASAPDLTVSKLEPDAVFTAIEKGSLQKGMPAYGQRMNKEQLEKLRDYVLQLRK